MWEMDLQNITLQLDWNLYYIFLLVLPNGSQINTTQPRVFLHTYLSLSKKEICPM